MVGIYKITSPNGKVYIGQSKDIELRWKGHINNPSNRFLKESFDKYGVSNHQFDVLQTCYEWELDEIEEGYILQYKATNPKFGFNLSTHSNGKYRSENRKHQTEFEKDGEEAQTVVNTLTKNMNNEEKLEFVIKNRELFGKSLRATWMYPIWSQNCTEDEMVDIEIRTLKKLIYGTQTR